jgi:archaetidylinositol phosphate synthase
VDYWLFAERLARRTGSLPAWGQRLLARFTAAPFAILVASGLTPLPFWPFKALAFGSGYPLGRYLGAIGVGRFLRYALLAWLGNILALPVWGVVGLSLAITGGLLILGPSKKDKAMKTDNEQEVAERTTQSITAAWEKRNLPKMAAALPQWVLPDHLTLLGIGAAGVVAAGYVLSHLSGWWLGLCLLGLVVHWAADSLDGTLARVRKIERERYGYYVDRTADAISTVLIGVGFGLSPHLHLSVAMMMTIGYLLLQLYAEICAYTSKRFPLSFGKIGPTEARIVLGLFTVGLFFHTPHNVMIGPFALTYVDMVVLVATTGLLSTFLTSSLKEAKYLDRLDRASMNTHEALTSSGFTVALPRDDED